MSLFFFNFIIWFLVVYLSALDWAYGDKESLFDLGK
ncbi:hypothetical protein C8P70_10325 [Myroides indicus]|uniref:Uncharacterized protein n=1 Tax=Myroides indicus TaxID=1323422 RepID=A0A4V3E9B8_9FLAO|nr:hypothetical protein C8P70_10325 [Myroides indicus]